MRRNGQAALEYLVTYGWGILAILVVVGALGYFGFLSPSRYIPERCAFSAQMECIDYLLEGSSVSDNGKIALRLRNNFGDDITIVRAYVHEGPITLTNPGGTVAVVKGNVSSAVNITIPVSYSSSRLVSSERQQLIITLEFQRTNPVGPLHNVTGTIFATVH